MKSNVKQRFRLGLVINPYAGIGGPTANKGSDDAETQARAQSGQALLTAGARANTFLRCLTDKVPNDVAFTVVTVPGPMGADSLAGVALHPELVKYLPPSTTTHFDTERSVTAIVERGVDLLVFVGGDGTARDVCRVVGREQVVLGVPAGVKMHSGVFAINPQYAADVVGLLISGDLVSVALQEVRDIDERAFRRGIVKSRCYGEMQTPEEGRFVQQVKQGGLEVEELVLLDIAEHLQEAFDNETLVIVGPGSTTFHILKNWGIDGTLLGVDLVRSGEFLAADVDAATIHHHLSRHHGPVALVLTAIGGQGHLIGRGNQQISTDVLRSVGRNNTHVVATKTKLKTLAGRPLVMDSGDPRLDAEWSGYVPVLTGYHDVVLYPLGYFTDEG